MWHCMWCSPLTAASDASLQRISCYFDNCICHKNCNCDMVLRDDARLVPCGSHLWAMQPMWTTITIEICPYKDPCHCTNLLVTLITLWLPYRLTLVSETDCVRYLPGGWPILPHWQSWEHSQGHSLQLRCHGNFHALGCKSCKIIPLITTVSSVCLQPG